MQQRKGAQVNKLQFSLYDKIILSAFDSFIIIIVYSCSNLILLSWQVTPKSCSLFTGTHISVQGALLTGRGAGILLLRFYTVHKKVALILHNLT